MKSICKIITSFLLRESRRMRLEVEKLTKEGGQNEALLVKFQLLDEIYTVTPTAIL